MLTELRPFNPKRIEHIFFDFDNTIWDYNKNAELTLAGLFKKNQVEENFGITFQDWYLTYVEINDKLWDALKKDEISKEELREKRFYLTFKRYGLEEKGLWQKFEDRFLKDITHYNNLVEGALELLEFLKINFNLHVLTNGFKEISFRKLKFSELEDYFETVTTGDDTARRKPHPMIFEHAMEKANAKVENSLYIGDEWNADVEGAGEIGMSVIFFNRTNDSRDLPELIKVKKLKEIIPFFQQVIEL